MNSFVDISLPLDKRHETSTFAVPTQVGWRREEIMSDAYAPAGAVT